MKKATLTLYKATMSFDAAMWLGTCAQIPRRVNVSMVELVPSKIPDKQEIKLVVLLQSLQSYANSLV